MPHRSARRQAARHPDAFTLTELLITIGIIVLLIGILIPTVTAVRRAAWAADTRNTMSQLISAITRYHQDHNAYPGAFRNQDFIGSNRIGLDGDVVEIGGSERITMSESLALALLGGLYYDSASGDVKFEAVRTTSARGPASLNPRSPKQYSAYLPAADRILSPGRMSDAGVVGMSDSVVPEFVDAWPEDERLPILYMRATVGASGILSENGGPLRQYDLEFIKPYLRSGTDGPTGLGSFTDDVGTDPASNGIGYFKHPSVPGVDNATGTPVEKDRFLLISAGPDRIFGTRDDIRSWGN